MLVRIGLFRILYTTARASQYTAALLLSFVDSWFARMECVRAERSKARHHNVIDKNTTQSFCGDMTKCKDNRVKLQDMNDVVE